MLSFLKIISIKLYIKESGYKLKYKKFGYDIIHQVRTDYEINAKVEFDKKKIKLKYWFKKAEFIEKVISRWHLRADSEKGIELRKLIRKQIIKTDLNDLTIDYTKNPVKVSMESIIFYEQIFSNEDFRKQYKALGKTW